jgi:hypothetical protein
MAGKRIVFIPFEGGVSADTAITNTVNSYQAKYPNCRVVEWSYYFPDKDWSKNQAESPLGNVNVEEDVIIVVGHGSFLRSDIGVKTGTTKPGLVLTDKGPKFEGGEILLSVEEVAARLDWMGLRSEHKYIKTLSCCGAGLGEFDPGANEINLGLVLNDKFPHTLARNLAKELGKNRTWKNKAYSAHPRIRVGGYPGFIDCKVKKEKLVSLAIEKDKDDPAVLTKKEPLRNMWGQTQRFGIGEAFGEVDKSEAFNRVRLEGVGIPQGRRVIMLPVKSNARVASNVPVIWYDAEGRVLYDKEEILPPPEKPQIPMGFRNQPK